MTRRHFMYGSAILSGSLLIGCGSSATADDSIDTHYPINPSTIPEEGMTHRQTWMAFVVNEYIWASYQIEEVERNLALLAVTISKYEPLSVLVSNNDRAKLIALLDDAGRGSHPIELVEFIADDLWMRDTGPIFVRNADGTKGGIDFNFNGWGEKQEHTQDSKVASFITSSVGTSIIHSNLVLEGGSIEVDGAGTAILTESSVLNNNRNPDITKEVFEEELKTLLGLKKIIWLKGIKGKDITDAHVDFYARFSKVGTVLVSRENYQDSYDYEVTRENIQILQNATDANGNRLEVVILDNPDIFNESFGVEDFAPGYMGYYLCNGAVVMQKFGDDVADQNALDIIQGQYPNRVVEQIAIDGIASGGGTIHCTTQQESLFKDRGALVAALSIILLN